MTQLVKVLSAVWRPVHEVLFGRRYPRSFDGRAQGGGSARMAYEGEAARLRMQGNSLEA